VTRLTKLRLYVAGDAPNSHQAKQNLAAVLEDVSEDYELEIIDCLADPMRSLSDGIVVTPTLLKVEPEPRQTVIGNLSDTEYLRRTIGL
jgi:circadian clock protein KaiB